ncbi:MAG: YbjN domain-containing protein [Acidimicrobiia bacterium]|nr:YbjN domain-containing protein [Acidimicrobiia bacterium]
MSDRCADPALAADAAALLHSHLFGPVLAESWVQAVEHDASIPRWYVRFTCDVRDAATIYFEVHQRTLRYEVFFLPDPPSGHVDLYRYLLRRNHSMHAAGIRFSLGPGDDLYLSGRMPLEHLDEVALDGIIGALYEAVETWFAQAVEIVRRDA